MNITKAFLEYYAKNKRDLPWRNTKSPYHIWLSEIIMQQTRIAQGTSYYNAFIEKYPTVFDLAQAGEQNVLLLWQGLGYYSRARNLYHTSKIIAEKYKGQFPDNYKEMIALKGIGDYTASAILSICFNLPLPAIDGNVLRIIARIFGIKQAVNQTSGRKAVSNICNDLICKENPGDFNQALMDFGSLCCTPALPNCSECFLRKECIAFQSKSVSELPVKDKSKPKKNEYFHYFLLRFEDNILIKQRKEGIWQNLYEFPLIVQTKKYSKNKIMAAFNAAFTESKNAKVFEQSETIKHVLSHKNLYITFYSVRWQYRKDFETVQQSGNFMSVKHDTLSDYPFPQVIRKFLERK